MEWHGVWPVQAPLGLQGSFWIIICCQNELRLCFSCLSSLQLHRQTKLALEAALENPRYAGTTYNLQDLMLYLRT
jgi:hypothetical protein